MLGKVLFYCAGSSSVAARKKKSGAFWKQQTVLQLQTFMVPYMKFYPDSPFCPIRKLRQSLLMPNLTDAFFISYKESHGFFYAPAQP